MSKPNSPEVIKACGKIYAMKYPLGKLEEELRLLKKTREDACAKLKTDEDVDIKEIYAIYLECKNLEFVVEEAIKIKRRQMKRKGE